MENQNVGFNSLLSNEVKPIILVYAARDIEPSDLRLVCSNWKNIIDQGTNKDLEESITYKNIGPVWKQCIHAWYGITKDNEKVMQQFLNGKLLYKPNKDNNEGIIELTILDLKNPFAGMFNLSLCNNPEWGNAGKYIAVMTGFRKGKMEKNKDKLEVWISPRFLIEKFKESTAKHFEPILKQWNGKLPFIKTWDEKIAPVTLFYTLGNWDNLSWYEYSMDKTPAELSTKSLGLNKGLTTRLNGTPWVDEFELGDPLAISLHQLTFQF